MLNIAGKVMMDRNAPEGLRDTPQSGYDDTKALIDAWHGKGRQHYAVTPRFAITSSPSRWRWHRHWCGSIPTCTCRRICRKPRRDRIHAALYPCERLHGRLRPLRPARRKACSGIASICRTARPTRCRLRLRGRLLPDLEPIPRLRPVRLPALPDTGKRPADRRGDRCRRRHQLLDAAHVGRGLQGDRSERREAESLRLLLADHARQRRHCRWRTGSARSNRARMPTLLCSTRWRRRP